MALRHIAVVFIENVGRDGQAGGNNGPNNPKSSDGGVAVGTIIVCGSVVATIPISAPRLCSVRFSSAVPRWHPNAPRPIWHGPPTFWQFCCCCASGICCLTVRERWGPHPTRHVSGGGCSACSLRCN